jgi:hypothetical protein
MAGERERRVAEGAQEAGTVRPSKGDGGGAGRERRLQRRSHEPGLSPAPLIAAQCPEDHGQRVGAGRSAHQHDVVVGLSSLATAGPRGSRAHTNHVL